MTGQTKQYGPRPRIATVKPPVTYCSTECASHRCTRPCGRVTEHPADEHGHICDDCASAIAGWF